MTKNIFRRRAFGSSLLLIVLGSFSPASSLLAATFNVSTEAELRAALLVSGSNQEADTIDLGGNTITLTFDPATNMGGELIIEVDENFTVTIQDGTIQRLATDEPFRLINILPDPTTENALVTLDRMTLTGGLFDAGNGVNMSGGGAVLVNRGLEIIDSELRNNSVIGNGNGGAVLAAIDGVIATNSQFINNSANAGSGGAIALSPNTGVIITSSLFEGNSAIDGGAVFLERNSITAQIFSSTFVDNRAIQLGGAIFNRVQPSNGIEIVRSTFVGNDADAGGAIYSQSPGSVNLVFATLVGNTASPGNGGGIRAETSSTTDDGSLFSTSVRLENTILADNIGGNCSEINDPLPLDLSFSAANIATDNTCGTQGITQLANSTGLFNGGLMDNGGPTPTLALALNSPAVDAATSRFCSNGADQRGVDTPDGISLSGGLCDVGAFELVPNLDMDADEVPDLTDNCPSISNTDQDNFDGDLMGDACDPDDDNDLTLDVDDAFPFDPSEDTDSDGDGVGNNADAFPNDDSETADTDGDGVGNNADAFPDDDSESADSDGDGVGDNADDSETIDTTAPPQVVPECKGHPATIYVDDNGIVVGGPLNGTTYTGTLSGTDYADVIVGTDGADNIRGRDGNDTICGLRGADTIYGDSGNDSILGGPGNDHLFGRRGRDHIRGEDGNDTIQGNRGNDFLYGGRGDDNIRGGLGNDVIRGGAGYDIVNGNNGSDDVRQ